MKRKRTIKLLMSYGFSRNEASRYANFIRIDTEKNKVSYKEIMELLDMTNKLVTKDGL